MKIKNKMDRQTQNSIKAAYTEFEKVPMKEYYKRPIIGYISRLRVKRIINELRRLGKLSDKVILDAGCEAGYISLKLLKNKAKVIAVDICEPAIEEFRKKVKALKKERDIEIILAPIQDIPLKNSSVDAIVCSEVIEHAPHLDKIIKEFCRVLKPGGVLILTFPNERVRELFYPIIKLFGVNTDADKEVTLFSYSIKGIIKECRKHLKVLKVYSIPPLLKITHFVICKKE